MKLFGPSMTSLRRIVCAGFAVGTMIGAMLPAEAGRQVHGGDVARLLMGRNFKIECVDGTEGRGQVTRTVPVVFVQVTDPVAPATWPASRAQVATRLDLPCLNLASARNGSSYLKRLLRV